MRRALILMFCAVLFIAAYLARAEIAPYLPFGIATALAPQKAADTTADAARPNGRAGARTPGKITVEVVAAKAGSLPIERQTIGTIVPTASTALGSPAAGIVAEVPAKDGAEVKAGDLLVRLDDRTIKATVARDRATITKDQATLDDANATLQRDLSLVKTGVDSKQAGDDAMAAVRVAQAAIDVDQAVLAGDEVALSQTEIRAPFDGQLGVVSPSVGAFVAPGASVATLTRMKPVYAEFTLPETDLDLARAALAAGKLGVSVRSSLSSRDAASTGPIIFIDNAVDPASATFKLRALLANDDGALWPGQSLDVKVTAGLQDGLVLVPNVAVEPQDSGAVSYVVKPDNTVDIRKVNVALRVGSMAGITDGLKAGESVVVEGQAALASGTAVRISTGAKPDAAAASNTAPTAGKASAS
jgi:multidrug efflux system membrane fusion protein